MLFNSIEFLVFLPIIFILYWFVFDKKLKHQNLLVLAGSYLFYGWWDYRFLTLILLSTIVDYFIGLYIEKESKQVNRKLLLWFSILFNLGVLGFFKYYNFFISSWIDLFSSFGYEIQSTWTLNIVLPVGISFYTFQTMSYTIDIYKKKLNPTKDFISFAAFVSFFPQLVAGPIERATNLLPQILKKRKFSYEQAIQGIRLILWGLFKKVVIADSLAPTVNEIFSTYQDLDGGSLWLGAIYFSFQIYCDFSGYSDIAIGTSKLFGFELMTNFRFPYFSRNIGEFWRRWHISLSTWFRDYLYIPLGGSRGSKWKALRNIFIVFTVSGFWHGSNWTFIAWGLVHALLFVPSFVFKTNRKYVSSDVTVDSYFPTLKELFQMMTTFLLVTVAWVFFRSDSLTNSFEYIDILFFDFGFPNQFKSYFIFYIIPFLIVDWFTMKLAKQRHNLLSLVISAVYIIYIILFWGRAKIDFIYFQF